MKKIVFIILLGLIVSQSSFAGILSVSVKNKTSKTEELEGESAKSNSGSIIGKFFNGNFASSANSVENFVETLMDNAVLFLTGYMNVEKTYDGEEDFGMIDTTGREKSVTYTANNLITGRTESRSFEVKGKSWAVFKWLILIWLIMSSAYFCYKRVADPNFQVRELPVMLFRIIVIMLIFWITPKLANFFVRTMWWLAERCTLGNPKEGISHISMTYAYIMKNLINAKVGTTLGKVAGVAGAASLVQATFWGVGASFQSLGNLGLVIFAILGVSIIIGLYITLTYCCTILELYLASWAFIVFLPSCLFKGFDFREMAVIKFYFTNALEIFIETCVIFIFSVLFKNVSIFGNTVIDMALDLIAKPVLLYAIFAMIPKICGSITTGGGVADSSSSAMQAGNVAMRAGRMSGGMAKTLNGSPSAAGGGTAGASVPNLSSRIASNAKDIGGKIKQIGSGNFPSNSISGMLQKHKANVAAKTS